MFFLFTGNKYTTTVSGTIRKHVQCRACGTSYDYQMKRKGKGAALSPYFLDNEGAATYSEEKARKSLDEKLTHEVEAVPCPRCGFYQPDMVALLRKRRFGWINVLGLLMIMVSPIVLSAFTPPNRFSPGGELSFRRIATTMPFVATVATGLGLVIFSLVGRNFLYDPNKRLPPMNLIEPRPEAPGDDGQAILSSLNFRHASSDFSRGSIVQQTHGTMAQQSGIERNAKDSRTREKVGRNEACPCGSGKRYKHCHGRLA
jgi:hypothetical protein